MPKVNSEVECDSCSGVADVALCTEHFEERLEEAREEGRAESIEQNKE